MIHRGGERAEITPHLSAATIGRAGIADRGTIYGMTSSAMFMGNSLGPLLGGFLAAGLGLSWVFLMTSAVLALNLIWVCYRAPEYQPSAAES